MLKSWVRTTPDSRLTAFVSPPPINQLGRKLNVCSGFTTSCISVTMATDEQMFCGLWTHVGLLVNLLATKTFRYCGVANIFRLECSDHVVCMHESSVYASILYPWHSFTLSVRDSLQLHFDTRKDVL